MSRRCNLGLHSKPVEKRRIDRNLGEGLWIGHRQLNCTRCGESVRGTDGLDDYEFAYTDFGSGYLWMPLCRGEVAREMEIPLLKMMLGLEFPTRHDVDTTPI